MFSFRKQNRQPAKNKAVNIMEDRVTEWSNLHNSYITTVYGNNPNGTRIMKYQVKHTGGPE